MGVGFSFLEGIHHFKKTRLVEIKCWTDHGKEVEIDGQDITEGLLALTKLPVAGYLASSEFNLDMPWVGSKHSWRSGGKVPENTMRLDARH